MQQQPETEVTIGGDDDEVDVGDDDGLEEVEEVEVTASNDDIGNIPLHSVRKACISI